MATEEGALVHLAVHQTEPAAQARGAEEREREKRKVPFNLVL